MWQNLPGEKDYRQSDSRKAVDYTPIKNLRRREHAEKKLLHNETECPLCKQPFVHPVKPDEPYGCYCTPYDVESFLIESGVIPDPMDIPYELKTSAEIAEEIGCHIRTVQGRQQELIDAGLAQRVGGMVIYKPGAVTYLRNLPDKTGLTGKNEHTKERIRAMLVASGVNHPEVWKGYSAGTKENGWHFREFGESQDVFLGKNFKDVKKGEIEL